jgi:hypothetical protein
MPVTISVCLILAVLLACSSTLNVDVRSFETLVNFYQTTLRYIPEDGALPAVSFELLFPFVSLPKQASAYRKLRFRLT